MQTTLFQNHDLAVRLCYYKSEQQMQPHSHDVHQISFLISGDLMEKNSSEGLEIFVPSIGVKPAGFVHANEYGNLGSLILSINVNSEYPLNDLPINLSDWRWQPQNSTQLANQIKSNLAIMLSANEQEKSALAWDLVALAEPPNLLEQKLPPIWLSRIRQQLHEDETCNIAKLAKAADVHPAYLSRAFSEYFGCAPTLYRARARFSRALEAIHKGFSIADAAHDAGFSDQAHFSRQAKKLSGIAPKKLQQMLFPA